MTGDVLAVPVCHRSHWVDAADRWLPGQLHFVREAAGYQPDMSALFDAVKNGAPSPGCLFLRLDLCSVGPGDLQLALAKVFQFERLGEPRYLQKEGGYLNWNSLADLLSDLQWLYKSPEHPRGPLVLLLDLTGSTLWQTDTIEFAVLITTLVDAMSYLATTGRAFHVIVGPTPCYLEAFLDLLRAQTRYCEPCQLADYADD